MKNFPLRVYYHFKTAKKIAHLLFTTSLLNSLTHIIKSSRVKKNDTAHSQCNRSMINISFHAAFELNHFAEASSLFSNFKPNTLICYAESTILCNSKRIRRKRSQKLISSFPLLIIQPFPTFS